MPLQRAMRLQCMLSTQLQLWQPPLQQPTAPGRPQASRLSMATGSRPPRMLPLQRDPRQAMQLVHGLRRQCPLPPAASALVRLPGRLRRNAMRPRNTLLRQQQVPARQPLRRRGLTPPGDLLLESRPCSCISRLAARRSSSLQVMAALHRTRSRLHRQLLHTLAWPPAQHRLSGQAAAMSRHCSCHARSRAHPWCLLRGQPSCQAWAAAH